MGDAPKGQGEGLLRPRVRGFQDLMQRRVQHILLVSSIYDSFILVEDGRINDAILSQFVELNLSNTPDVTRVSTGQEALERARDRRFDLVITSVHVGDMNAVELAHKLQEAELRIPVVLLAYNNRALTDFRAQNDLTPIDRIFLWQGDVRILLAMVNYVEDRWNVDHDTGDLGVPAILVVEDNVRFYSSFLPLIYAELMDHTHRLISEGLNLSQKMLRMRARPKILLCNTYEEAWAYFTRYEEHILGIISDIEFPKEGEPNRMAGIDLVSKVREVRSDVSIVLQSSIPDNARLAESIGARFLLKGSPTLLNQLSKILLENFGFGDFVFHLPDGKEIDRAHNLRSLAEKVRTVPAASLAYHGERNHFSHWLKARTEFALAGRLRPRQVSDFESLEHLRQDLMDAISEYRRTRDRVIVADFHRKDFDTTSSMSRIGGGSLGGKARGLAFINRLLNESRIYERFPQIDICVPTAAVLGTDIFDQFLAQQDLRQMAIESTSDEETWRRFTGAPFPEEAVADLRAFLATIRTPLAVRSSGLLEDSINQPFAGVYRTFMIPNNHPDPEMRLIQLIAAVKRVYASTFSMQAKSFLEMTPYRLEEEKMAVIIQTIVGTAHATRFYPDFAGVARSHNFYPAPPMKARDGIAAVGLGMGRTVVDGGACVRFSPEHPKHLIGFSSADEALKNSQREFYALNLSEEPGKEGAEGAELSHYGLSVAEQDRTLSNLGSTYSPDNDVIYDGIARPGVRLVNFAPILKHEAFPLAELLKDLLALGTEGTSAEVEIEFAVNLSVPDGTPPQFGFLQMRPLAMASETEVLEIGHVLASKLICRSSKVLGNGVDAGLADLIVVGHGTFDRLKSLQVAEELARFNAELQSEGRPYLLVGVGRWGSTDPHLGIPVRWNQIAGARVIVEAGFKDLKVTPSQGTHFFQNLTSCNVGYFTVNPECGEGFVDWDWLARQPAVRETAFVRHIRLSRPITVKMSGMTSEGVILKPDDE